MVRFLLLAFFCCLSTASFAQLRVDAKINVGSLVTGGINVSGDAMVDPNLSVAVGLAYATTKFSLNDEEFRRRGARLIPEVRYYVSPSLGADRFFVGAYGKVVLVRAEEIGADLLLSGTRGVLGVLMGYKWVSERGIVIETNAGLGRGTFFGARDLSSRAFGFASSFDLRLGILAGYRF
ncbi:DUF3575 domain-containing protein [Neolewinella antarctica]|uniref:Outer membrane protein beta-barrel domain-containing protein n=1 Tax=Neolewinella antarctica TaxID=442734 RepID=A0ABX0XA36_9BACT|nr:DUF3575 domain-containing protein [Neolewinella antarctica]NJC25910.1 hypothetical protein [Neolewinella antarctica]